MRAFLISYVHQAQTSPVSLRLILVHELSKFCHYFLSAKVDIWMRLLVAKKESSFSSRLTIFCRTIDLKHHIAWQLRDVINSTNSNLHITPKAQFSSKYTCFIWTIRHWTDSTWNIRQVVLQFQRFAPYHIEYVSFDLLKEVLINSNLQVEFRSKLLTAHMISFFAY